MEDRIKTVLDSVRPMLALHRGGLEFVGFDAETGILQLRLTGACQGCPYSALTLKGGIESLLKAKIPEVASVEAV